MKTSELLFTKLCSAPGSWLRSAAGRRLIAKSARLIKRQEGRETARHFINQLTCASIID